MATTKLYDLVESVKCNGKLVIRFDGVDYLINDVYLDRGDIILESGRCNEDDGSDVTENDIV